MMFRGEKKSIQQPSDEKLVENEWQKEEYIHPECCPRGIKDMRDLILKGLQGDIVCEIRQQSSLDRFFGWNLQETKFMNK